MLNLQQLLQQSQQLESTLQAPAAAAVPAALDLHRNLDQVAARSQRLVERSMLEQSMRATAMAPAAVDATAQSFLAQSGFNFEALKHDLDELDLGRTLEPIRLVSDTDVEGFVNNEHDNMVMTTLEESKVKTAWDAECLVQQALNADWELMRRDIMAKVGPYQAYDTEAATTTTTTATTTDRGLLTSPVMATAAAPALEAKTQAYLHVVEAMNNPATANSLNVIDRMAKVATAPAELAESWLILNAMLQPAKAGPLEYAAQYLSPDPTVRAEIQTQLLAGSRAYLEDAFYAFVDETIRRQPKAAMMGGDPTVTKRVEAFVRLRFQKYDHWDLPHAEFDATTGMPMWVVVYFLMRCGKCTEALAYLNQAALLPSDESFRLYFAAWCHGELFPGFEKDLAEYYDALLIQPTPTDPYKLAVMKLVGRCELQSKRFEGIILSTEDWLWARLVLLGDKYTAADLCAEMGQLDAYLAKKQAPLVYFNLLLLCGLFEKAILTLARRAEFQVDALHVALALHYYGCLHVPVDPTDVRGLPSLDMASVPLHSMILHHLTRIDHASELAYIVRLAHAASLPAYAAWKDFAYEELVQWVQAAPLQTAPLGLSDAHLALLGFATNADFLHTIVATAANRAADQDRLDDALYLYEQCHDAPKVLVTLTHRLARAFLLGPDVGAGATAPRTLDALLAHAEQLLSRYSQDAPARVASAATTLWQMAYFKLLVTRDAMAAAPSTLRRGEMPATAVEAWQALRACALVPADARASPAEFVARIAALDPVVTPCVPDLIRMAMDLAVRTFRATRDPEMVATARQIRVVAGMVPVKMDPQLHAYLAQREVEVGKVLAEA
ncbi:hypothetical protein GGF32_008363 [Allomyces javanicus]|nr:hypothetical protein GGF32_008363 [Allomyces javanicus]